MLIEYWADYICPWCYLALDRVGYLTERHGAEVRWRPFELHPEIPAEGDTAPPIRRTRDTTDWLRRELAGADLPVAPRTTWSNSRRALALSAWAEDLPEWPTLHRAIYHAYFVEGVDIGDPGALVAIATAAGLPPEETARSVADGKGRDRVVESRERALDLGIGATPGWHIESGVVFTGVHEREVYDRVIARAAR